jgi:hypothetical protein
LTDKAQYYKNPQATKIRVKKKYHANAETIRAKRRASYLKNREAEKTAAKTRSAEWRLKNPQHEGIKQAKKRYKKTNPGKTNAATVKRRVAKMHRTPKWLTADEHWMIEQVYELAALRTKMFGFQWHVDHILPLQGKNVSGLHVPANLRVVPWIENVSKSNKHTPA